ncbi:hypothetical protein IJ818_01145 [bacterium]|nr:hypothetical protein [bacterium]
MTSKYKFTFKKDDVFIEYCTTDKESLSRQFQIWVTCASIYQYRHKEEELREEIQQRAMNTQTPIQVELKPEPIVLPMEDVHKESVNSDYANKMTLNDLQNKSKDEISEYKKSEEETLAEKKQEIAQTVEQAGQISGHLDDLYSNENKILNSFESFKEKLEDDDIFSNKTADFDKILEHSMNNVVQEIEISKDDRFLKILNVKNVSTKLEYLIVTAYYLSEFEKLDKFTLKLINAKLMQNIQEAVDHNVLQEAIDRGLVETLPNLPEISGSVEYRLTNLGEEVFLNGTKF